MRIIFKNRDNIILVLFKNCSYYFNLIFSMFFVFSEKKIGTKGVCLVIAFKNYFLIIKNKKNKEIMNNMFLFFFLKNINNKTQEIENSKNINSF